MSGDLKPLKIKTYPGQDFSKEGTTWSALFNPSEYSLTRSNNYSQTQSQNASKPSTAFAGGNPDQLSIAFFFDGTGVAGPAGPVTQIVKQFLDLLRYDGSNHKPLYMRVVWGGPSGGLDFPCFLKSATAAYTLFNREGEPLRVRINASFEEVVAPAERLAREDKASPDLFRVWIVHEGERLDQIAAEAYDDPAMWRAIASANRLAAPRSLVSGQELMLPPKEV
jgi:contractile injection system tube protein